MIRQESGRCSYCAAEQLPATFVSDATCRFWKALLVPLLEVVPEEPAVLVSWLPAFALPVIRTS